MQSKAEKDMVLLDKDMKKIEDSLPDDVELLSEDTGEIDSEGNRIYNIQIKVLDTNITQN